jgi:hypothetical protein
MATSEAATRTTLDMLGPSRPPCVPTVNLLPPRARVLQAAYDAGHSRPVRQTGRRPDREAYRDLTRRTHAHAARLCEYGKPLGIDDVPR